MVPWDEFARLLRFSAHVAKGHEMLDAKPNETPKYYQVLQASIVSGLSDCWIDFTMRLPVGQRIVHVYRHRHITAFRIYWTKTQMLCLVCNTCGRYLRQSEFYTPSHLVVYWKKNPQIPPATMATTVYVMPIPITVSRCRPNPMLEFLLNTSFEVHGVT